MHGSSVVCEVMFSPKFRLDVGSSSFLHVLLPATISDHFSLRFDSLLNDTLCSLFYFVIHFIMRVKYF